MSHDTKSVQRRPRIGPDRPNGAPDRPRQVGATVPLCPRCGSRCSAPELFEGYHVGCAPAAVAARHLARVQAAAAGQHTSPAVAA